MRGPSWIERRTAREIMGKDHGVDGIAIEDLCDTIANVARDAAMVERPDEIDPARDAAIDAAVERAISSGVESILDRVNACCEYAKQAGIDSQADEIEAQKSAADTAEAERDAVRAKAEELAGAVLAAIGTAYTDAPALCALRTLAEDLIPSPAARLRAIHRARYA